ncbi:HYC_CC_PP family protein [Flavobacterium sp. RHBU_24]|uniref:HYC_CC_PP family protein n=1 Tax=Flavobacterium sp. RHBU_24 TaxID=3391185 RepID=UPI0039851C12
MQFKRFIGALLSALILFSNIGLALNVHYCHGSVSAVTLAYSQKDACAEKAETKKGACCAAPNESHKSCCKNSIVKLQDKTDTAITKSLQLDLGVFYAVDVYHPITIFYADAPVTVKDSPSFYADSNAPPLYKLYCQYVLYA